MKNAVWYSRHNPSESQIEEIKKMGFELVDLNYGLELGGLNAVDKKTLEMILASLNGMVEKNEAKAVFGVFSAPVQETLLTTSGIPCYSAWNVMRTVEGERPTFEHQRFCLTGRM